jgi:DNA primase
MQVSASPILDAVAELCARALSSEAGKATRAGVIARKHLRASVAPFRLGYFQNASWLHASLREAGYQELDIRKSGVLRRDVEDALVIPWTDAAGRVLGLVYRRNQPIVTQTPNGPSDIRYALLGDRDQLPLQGSNEARAAGYETLVVVEGSTDFLTLKLAGADDVATPHTCFIRPPQLLKLKAIGFRRLILCFDPDFAGWRGMLSATEGAFAAGLDVRIARAGKADEDVDEFVLRNGLSAFRRSLLDAEDGLSVYAGAVISAAATTPEPKASAADLAARFAILAPSPEAAARLNQEFWPKIDAFAGAQLRIAATDRIAEASAGRRLQISPIGSLLRNQR